MNRRHFIATTTAAAATTPRAATLDPPLVGVQMAPFNLLYEGIDDCLERLDDKAAVNTLICYTHTYYGGSTNKPVAVLAPDHGVDVDNYFKGAMPEVWVRHDPARFEGLLLQHQPVDPDLRYADRDLFREMRAPTRERGMRIYARYFDPKGDSGMGKIANWERVRTVDVEGEPGGGPCWNHPEYRRFTIATFLDMAANYELDGILWGSEIPGPLSEPLYWSRPPACFCKHCEAWAGDHGIDLGRAREGFLKLWTAIKTDDFPAHQHRFVTLLGLLQRYPEMLGWNHQSERAMEAYRRAVYTAVKAEHPDLDMGRHIDNQITGWDLLARGLTDWPEMARADDFLRGSLYFHILGPRLRNFGIGNLNDTILKDVPEELSLQLHYHLLGLDPKAQPADLEALEQEGLDPEDYITPMVRSSVEQVAGKARICPAIGFDVPNWGGDKAWDEMETFRTPPDAIERAVHAAHAGGAHGIMAAREYDEMRVPSLEAFGRAARANFLA